MTLLLEYLCEPHVFFPLSPFPVSLFMHTWFLQAGLGVMFSLPSSNTFGSCLLWHLKKKEQTWITLKHPRTGAYLEVWIIIPEFSIFQIHFPYFVAGTTYCQFTRPYQWTEFFLKCHALLNSSSLLLWKHILSLESNIYKVLRRLNILKLFWKYLMKNLKKYFLFQYFSRRKKIKIILVTLILWPFSVRADLLWSWIQVFVIFPSLTRDWN